jgi:peptidoglycan-N-acetylmuramic acid deacetylase
VKGDGRMWWRRVSLLCFVCLLFFPYSNTSAITYSNAKTHWGFKKSVNHIPPSAGEQLEKLLEKHNSYYIGNPSKKDIYLTFDNGYENGYTSSVLDTLKRNKVPAAFFVTGYYLKNQPNLVKRMVADGHIVGNHSWHHPDLTEVSDVRLKKELQLVREEYQQLTGANMNYLRVPRGIFSERTLAHSEQLGYINVFWSLAFVDWYTDKQQGWKYSYNQVMNQIHPGSILLLHTVSKDNAEALDKIIKDLQAQGYTFKSLDDLMIEKMIPDPLLFSFS